MKRYVETTGTPLGTPGLDARSRWSGSAANGLDRQWGIPAHAMTAKQAFPAAQRPLGFAGGGYR